MSTRRDRFVENGAMENTRERRTKYPHRRRKRRPARERHRLLKSCDDGWWRCNRSIRFYGVVFLVGTKLADVVTTAVGVRYIPAIVEANPVADHLFVELGLFTGLTVVGFATVFFAVCAAELFGLEVRRRFGLPKTALFAQASIYLVLSTLFGLVAIYNALLIADQVAYMLGDMLLVSVIFCG